jgi:hypothetical protein
MRYASGCGSVYGGDGESTRRVCALTWLYECVFVLPKAARAIELN